jgi:hypothetical protein
MREGPWSITLLSEKDGPTVRKITSFPLAFLQNVFLRLVMERKNRQILGIMKKPGQKTEGPILLSRLNNEAEHSSGSVDASRGELVHGKKIANR